jgi:hypothetical protein
MVCEPSLTVHLFVGFRDAAERIFLDHRVHAGQRAEFQSVLRIAPGPPLNWRRVSSCKDRSVLLT